VSYTEQRATERTRARSVLDQDERSDLLAQIRYWKGMYGTVTEILATAHPDPAYRWLDELTRVGAVPKNSHAAEVNRWIGQAHGFDG